MPAKEYFHPARPLPLVIADQIEHREIEGTCDQAVAPSRVVKASVLIAAVMATGIAILSVGDPATLYADVTASLVGNPVLQPDTDPSTAKIQSIAEAPASVQFAADPQPAPPNAKDIPAREEIAASEPAGKDQTEESMPTSDALFRQFQAWAAEQDAQANVRQPDQDAPALVANKVAENAPAPDRLIRKRRHVRPVRNARAEARPEITRKKVRRTASARVERPPAEDARAQAGPVQDTQGPSFLSSFGWRN